MEITATEILITQLGQCHETAIETATLYHDGAIVLACVGTYLLVIGAILLIQNIRYEKFLKSNDKLRKSFVEWKHKKYKDEI